MTNSTRDYSLTASASVTTEIPKSITVGNGNSLEVQARGNVQLSGITLSNVLLVPDLCTNLLSVSQALDSGNIDSVVFTRSKCRFMIENNIVAAEAHRKDRLWKLPTSEVIDNGSQRTTALHAEQKQIPSRSLDEWHVHLAHTNYSTIIEMVKRGIIKTSSHLDEPIPACSSCIEGKMARLPFTPSQTPRALAPGDLTHADLIGPMETKSYNGFRYILTLVDDNTRYLTAIAIRHKSDARFEIIKYINELLKSGRRPEYFRSDNGTEFLNSCLTNFFQEHDIQQQNSTRYSPQQNGVAERANRTIIEGARTLLIANSLPKRFWPEAVGATVTARNLVPSRTTKTVLYSEFMSKVAPYDDIAFCQQVFVHIPDEKRKKLDAKAEIMRYLGPAKEQKAMKFLNKSNRVITSRDFKVTTLISAPVQVATVPSESEISREPTPVQSTATKPMKSVRSTRRKTQPVRFADQHFSYAAITSDSPVLLDPATYEDAINSKNAHECQWAMESEYQSLNENGTWELRPLPKGRRAIGAKWVYKTKTDKNGNIARFKAQFVAKGFKQVEGVDFDETFAPTVNKTSLRILIAIAAANSWPLHNLDALTAFLNGVMDKEVFIEQPKGFEVVGTNGERLYCFLKKAIYGLKQAGRTWWQAIHQHLISIGFTASPSDTCLYVRTRGAKIVILAIYVDDFIVTGSDQLCLNEFKKELQAKYKINDLGPLELTLGMRVDRCADTGTITISQAAYTKAVLQKFQMSDCRPCVTPQIQNGTMTGAQETTTAHHGVKFPYREAVGALLYLSTCTRPDIAVAVNQAARYCNNPSEANVIAVKRVMRYLAGTINNGIAFARSKTYPELKAYVDADWAGDKSDRKSISGFVILLNGPVIWGAVKQSCVALSTAEAEYVALSRATQEVLWLRQMLADIGFPQRSPTVVYEDNAAALIMANTPVTTARSKHIDIRHHFLRECITNQQIRLVPCASINMIADLLTKPLTYSRFKILCNDLGMTGNAQASSGACWNQFRMPDLPSDSVGSNESAHDRDDPACVNSCTPSSNSQVA